MLDAERCTLLRSVTGGIFRGLEDVSDLDGYFRHDGGRWEP